MRSFGRIGATAAAAALVLIGVELALGAASPGAHGAYIAGVRIAAYLSAAIAAGTTASTFGWWREAVGRPWTLFSVEFALLLVNYLLRLSVPTARSWMAAALIAANLAQISACYLVAVSMRAAGLADIVSRSRRAAFTVAAAVVAVLISGPAILHQWHLISAGSATAGSIVSLTSDLITFTLIAPLLMSTLALRGGQLFWMFEFLTISVFGWMFNQIGSSLADVLHDPAAAGTMRLTGVLIATSFNAAAAITQQVAARQATRGAFANA